MESDNEGGGAGAGTERRRDIRAYASPPAQIIRLGGSERIEILNASYRGLFIRTPFGPPPLNQVLKIAIQLPTKQISIHVIPVRVVSDAQGRPQGVGVRFFALNGEDKRLWESYIGGLLASPRRVAA